MDPSEQTLAASLVVNPVPRRFPVPEGAAGPPPVFSSIVAAPVLAQAQEILDPIAAQITATIRGAIAGAPEALATIAANVPSPGSVLTMAGLGLGVASLAAGVSGKAALLLAGPAAGVPYLGAGLAAWGAAAPIASAALGALGAGYGVVGQTLQGVTAPVNFNALMQQWGQLLPNPAAAVPPPPSTMV